MKYGFIALAAAACVCFAPLQASAIVINFDDLAYSATVTGTNYAGLTWEKGNAGYSGNVGFWGAPRSDSSYPNTQPHNLINYWGSTFIGIGFNRLVNVNGAFFAAQGAVSSWTKQVRVHGYRSGIETATTNWFKDIDAHPDWFAINLSNVDRIVIESTPVNSGGGWYGMDDLTYEPVPEPSSILSVFCGVAGIAGAALRRRK